MQVQEWILVWSPIQFNFNNRMKSSQFDQSNTLKRFVVLFAQGVGGL
jgi:hypothetical protein